MIRCGRIKLTPPVSVFQERRPPKLPVDHRDEVVYLFSDGERRYYAGWRGFYYMLLNNNVFRIAEYKGVYPHEDEEADAAFSPLNWWYHILLPQQYAEIKNLHAKGKRWHIPYVRDLLERMLYGTVDLAMALDYQRYVVSYEPYYGVGQLEHRFKFVPRNAMCELVIPGFKCDYTRYMFTDTFTGEQYYVTEEGFVVEYDEEREDGYQEKILWYADIIGDRTWRDALNRRKRKEMERLYRKGGYWWAAISEEVAIWVTENMITGLYQL